MTATREQVVRSFLSKRYSEWTQANWGLHSARDYWDVDECTYINGVPLIVDLDFEMGYLLEIVEKDSSVVSYVAIVTAPNGHDSMWYGELVGKFFDRTLEPPDAMRWGLDSIEEMLDGLRWARAFCRRGLSLPKG